MGLPLYLLISKMLFLSETNNTGESVLLGTELIEEICCYVLHIHTSDKDIESYKNIWSQSFGETRKIVPA